MKLGGWQGLILQDLLVLIFHLLIMFFKDFIYFLERAHEWGGGVVAEGEGGRLPAEQRARQGSPSQDPGSRPEPKADAQPTEPPRCPIYL